MEPTETVKGSAAADRAWVAGLAAILVLAALLRLLGIDWMPGLNGDEAGWGRLSQRLMDGRRSFTESYMADRGPLFGVVQMAGIRLIGDEPEALRLSTALAGTLLALLVWVILARRGERRWALFAASWVALDPLLVGWSRIGMEIMLLPFLNTLILVLLLEHLRTGPRFALPAAALAASIAMQMHPLESVFLGCLGVAIVVAGMWRPVVFSAPFRVAALLFIVTYPPHLYWLRHARPELMLVNSREIRPATPDPVEHVQKMIQEGPGPARRFDYLIDCLDGTRVVEYVTGSSRPPLVRGPSFRLLFLLLLVAAPLALLARREPDPFGRFLVTGFVTGVALALLVSFYTNTSHEVPGHERYVLLLLVPWWPLVATSAFAGPGPLRGPRLGLGIAVVVTLTGLTSVTVNGLILPCRDDGGHGDAPFVTNDPMPAELAAGFLAREKERGARVLSQDLHLKEALDFLTRERVEFETTPYFPGPDLEERLPGLSGRTWIAVLAATELGAHLEARLAGKARRRQVYSARDGRPVIVAYELEGPVR